jgi:hypothetical protein
MENIKLYGTYEGKLYIKPEELFQLEKVKQTILACSKIKCGKRQ